MRRVLADPEWIDPSVVFRALGKLGRLATFLLPLLREALTWRYTWYSPEERYTEEMRVVIREAIEKIEAAPAV